ncbi:MAG TPA: hypothetical protein VHY59_10050, partial [Chthoniobacterales bacterium]|nr:hypothetical protein [Chthoniobacterales bacterium]
MIATSVCVLLQRMMVSADRWDMVLRNRATTDPRCAGSSSELSDEAYVGGRLRPRSRKRPL